MKKGFAFLLALTACLVFAACEMNGGAAQTVADVPPQPASAAPAPSPAAAPEDAITKQIRLLAGNMPLWQCDGTAEMYGYAVTDMDGNGRLELVASSCGGTGIYTNTDIWEVNESLNGLALCAQEKEEGGSQADIMVQSAPVYYDAAEDIYYFVFDDIAKNGAAEYYESKRALSLRNGRISETFLGYRTTLYADSVPAVACTDAEGNPISEEEYGAIEDRVFAGMEKLRASMAWVTNATAELDAVDAAEMYALLAGAYRAFSVG